MLMHNQCILRAESHENVLKIRTKEIIIERPKFIIANGSNNCCESREFNRFPLQNTVPETTGAFVACQMSHLVIPKLHVSLLNLSSNHISKYSQMDSLKYFEISVPRHI